MYISGTCNNTKNEYLTLSGVLVIGNHPKSKDYKNVIFFFINPIFCLCIVTKQLICNLLSTVLNKGLQFLKTIYTKSFFGIGLLQVDAG